VRRALRSWPAPLLAGAVILVGCGNRRTAPLGLTGSVTPVGGSRVVAYQPEGVAFRVPSGWFVRAGAPPLVASASAGLAEVAVWRYPRVQPLPGTPAQLRRALPSLLAAVRARDSGFRLEGSRTLRIDHHPALQVVGVENVAGAVRRVRSDHVFAFGGEVVLDAYAPLATFAAANRSGFIPILHSLRLASTG
jgi:hypothetical protein